MKYADKVTEFVIPRSKWARGKSKNPNYLYNPNNGKMCCLGIYGEACGLSIESMKKIDGPTSHIESTIVEETTFPSSFYIIDSTWPVKEVSELIELNDSVVYDESKREKLIQEKFAEIGIAVTFVD